MANVDNFQVTFCGVPFRTPTKELVDRLKRHSWLPDLRDVLFDNSVWPGSSLQRAGIPKPLPYPELEIGDYFYPTGASRFSIYRGIMTAEDLETVKAVVWASSSTQVAGEFTMSANPYPSLERLMDDSLWEENTHPFGYVRTNLFMLPPLPLVGQFGTTAAKDEADLYLVTLVDERYFWHQYVDSGATLLTDAGQITWTQIADQVTNNLNIGTGLISVFSDDLYPETDSPIYCQYESAAAFLDAVCANLHQVLIRNFDGTYSSACVGPGVGMGYLAGNAALQANGSFTIPTPRVLGGLAFIGNEADAAVGVDLEAAPSDEFRAVIPQYVKVVFPKWITGTGYYEPTARRSQFKRDSFGSTWTVTIAATDVIGAGRKFFSGTKVLKTTAKAEFATSVSATPTNTTETDALALWLARSWIYSRMIWSDQVFRGIVGGSGSVLPFDRLWRWNDGNVFTRYMANPLNWGWSEYCHSFDGPSLTQPALSISNGGTGTSSLTTGQVMVGGSSSVDQLTSTRTSGETLECKLTTDRWVGFSSGSY